MDLNDSNEEGDLSNIPTRPMRIKILYTFDADSKTTCLARFPDTRHIPAVSIDEQSQVGIIDLHECIPAVVSASPEILSKLDSGDDSACYTGAFRPLHLLWYEPDPTDPKTNPRGIRRRDWSADQLKPPLSPR